MTTVQRIGTLLLLSLVALHTPQQANVIRLTVEKNGHRAPAPTSVALIFNGRSLSIPVDNGTFRVPPEVFAADKVTVLVDIAPDHVRVPDLWTVRFTEEHWTIKLADRSFGKEYETIVPRTAVVASSCILEFESYGTLGTGSFVPDCRSRDR
jgi:hypothetical protein